MIKKIILSALAFSFIGFSILQAQETEQVTTVSDEDIMTTEEQPNPFPPRPKDMWELGIQGGSSVISGDVSTRYPVPLGGFAAGIHVRKAFNYTFSIRLEGNYGETIGIDKQLSTVRSVNSDINLIGMGYAPDDYFVKNHKTTFFEGSVQGIMNMGNLLFHNRENKWNIYAMVGVGGLMHKAWINGLDGSQPYDFGNRAANDMGGFTDGKTIKKRKANQNRFLELADGDFETRSKYGSRGQVLYNDNKVIPVFQSGLGLSRKITDRFNVGLEYKIILSGSDDLDGFSSGTHHNDILHITTVQLNFNLGSQTKRVEPLYWVNPLVAPMEDLAEVKARPSLLDLEDSDGDGVPDIWDEDPNTPPGVAVDVKGRPIDSDGDGIPDYLDKEPFSPKGYEVDEDGVAIIDDPYLTESQVVNLIQNEVKNAKINWFLPMIHFDLDKYYVKPEYVSHLKNVAQVIKTNPDIKVAVQGYADNRASEDYNNVLSYNRAEAAINYLVENFDVPRDRLVLQYRGESSPLIGGLPDNHSLDKTEEYMQYMNRRVEFTIATPGDKEMAKPDGPKAGSGTPGSSRTGAKYSGNRDSGY